MLAGGRRGRVATARAGELGGCGRCPRSVPEPEAAARWRDWKVSGERVRAGPLERVRDSCGVLDAGTDQARSGLERTPRCLRRPGRAGGREPTAPDAVRRVTFRLPPGVVFSRGFHPEPDSPLAHACESLATIFWACRTPAALLVITASGPISFSLQSGPSARVHSLPTAGAGRGPGCVSLRELLTLPWPVVLGDRLLARLHSISREGCQEHLPRKWPRPA